MVTKKLFLEELVDITRKNLKETEKLLQLSVKELNQKKNETDWSPLECIAHLNIYGEFYLPEIEKCINNAPTDTTATFRSGVLGSYFVKLIKPKEKLNKMITLEKFNFIGVELSKDVLIHFKKQQEKMLELLSRLSNVNLTKRKTAISISKLIKLRLGDTLSFVTFHNQRHLIQAIKGVNLFITSK